MCHTPGGKKSVTPWGECDHPDTDARWKWVLSENYTDFMTAREWADKHP